MPRSTRCDPRIGTLVCATSRRNQQRKNENSRSSSRMPLTSAAKTLTGPRTQGRRPIVKRSSGVDRKSTRLNSSHSQISYAVFCLKKKKTQNLNQSAQLCVGLFADYHPPRRPF